jgi:LuxR family maltose regulon positive regulatory protein
LDAGLADARLILVSAPAGYGKTTLLADWLAGSRIPAGWVSLDATDNDPARFFRYLLAAARAAVVDSPESVSGFIRPPPEQSDAALSEIINLLTCAPGDVVLVLDDYHTITSPVVHQSVASLLDHLPPQAHLAIATRADPPLPLARLRARAELLELRDDPLRFTPVEAEGFLNGTLGLELSAQDIAHLVERTEGWVAGLQLAGLSLQGRSDCAPFIREFSGSHRFVLDYLVEEVLEQQPADVQAFLLRTAVLDRLCAPLCDAVTQQAGSQTMLETLERANLFVVPLDEERHWYRYHHLFAELLRVRLRLLRPDEEPLHHARAAAWCDQHGLASQAVAHARAAGDLPRVVELVERHWIPLGHAGELDTVLHWLDSLPETLVRSHPQLSTAYAWMLALKGFTEGVEERLRDAEAALASGSLPAMLRDPADVPPQIACLRSQLARMAGDPAGAVVHARRALELVPEGLPLALDAVLRGDAQILLAHALRDAGDLTAAASAYRVARPLLQAGGNALAVGHVTYNLALLELRQGNVAKAEAVCRATLDEAGSAEEQNQPALASAHLALAEVLAAQGDLEAAEAEASRGIELSLRGGAVRTAQMGREVLSRVRQTRAISRNGQSARHTHGLLPEALTDREMDVLRLAALGHSNRRIADELVVASGTVKAHMHAICGKLGAENRVQAIARARDLGLLT